MQQPDLMRLLTMGSVDDGKSTLLGRLLLDANALPPDQLSAAETHSRSRGDEYLDLSLLTDGLKAEREQGITIDVAYRYFSTPTRRFILADCPGHVQYTRNLFTGASTAEVAVILVDARKGILEQTRRHLYIASLLRLQQVVLCINKMDLVDYREEVYRKVVQETTQLVKQLGLEQMQYLPISALKGDNVVSLSEEMVWFRGEPLLPLLEKLPKDQQKFTGLRLPVQHVVRPQSESLQDFRGYAGCLESGTLQVGQRVQVQPSNFTTQIKSIHIFEQELQQAEAPQAVVVTLQDELDVSRGEIICDVTQPLQQRQELTVKLCWLSQKPLQPRLRFLLKHGTSFIKCMVTELQEQVNLQTLQPEKQPTELSANSIGQVRLRLANPLAYDVFAVAKATGCLLLIDETTNETVAGGVIV